MDRLDRTLDAARRRLRLRAVVRAVAVAAHLGLWTALGVAVVGRLAGVPLPAVGLAALTVAAAGIALGAVAGLVTRGLDRRAAALLLDRLGGTDETVLTAVHVDGVEDPNRDAILARFDALALAPAALIEVRVPRHLRWAAPEAALVALALALVPPLGFAWPWATAPSELVREGQRLEERLAELTEDPEAPALPEAIEREVAELADDLQDGALSPEDARDRLQDLQDRLAEHEERLAASGDLLQDLEQAAQALDEQGTERLAEALQEGDLAEAADAARDLSEALAEASPEERARAAEALQQAGEALARSDDPQLQQVGQAMRSAGQASKPNPGTSPTGEQAGTPDAAGASDPSDASQGTSGASSGLTPQQAQDLANELARAQQLGDQLQRDQAALQRSQALNGALEASRQRLGGEAQVAGGQASGAGSSEGRGEGGGGEGTEPGTGNGSGSGGGGGVGSGAGTSGHTWEDQGEFQGRGGGGAAEDRLSDRRGGRHVDDFQKLYEELRLAGAQSLLAGTEGQIDERGVVEQLPVRITTGDEDATTPSVQIPAAWRDEAVEAIEAEPVPPAYEQAVKQYFDVK